MAESEERLDEPFKKKMVREQRIDLHNRTKELSAAEMPVWNGSRGYGEKMAANGGCWQHFFTRMQQNKQRTTDSIGTGIPLPVEQTMDQTGGNGSAQS